VKIALAQLNPTVGAIRSNADLVIDAVDRAVSRGARLVVTPELIISGYPPKDLLLRESFVAACDAMVEELAGRLPADVGLLVGHPTHRDVPDGRIANGASLVFDGRIERTIHKTLLPNYDVFDEQRYFRPASGQSPILFEGLRLGVHICEDAWWGEPDTFYHDLSSPQPDPLAVLADRGVDLFINLSASPFEINKPGCRYRLASRHVAAHNVPMLFVNQVGGNDDLVFDGQSFVVDSSDGPSVVLPSFEEAVTVVDINDLPPAVETAAEDREASLLKALTLGLGDYMNKCGFSDCILGLSGGIDSAVAACIATRAIGPSHVHALLMPSRFSSDHSVEDARLLADNLGIDHHTLPIESIHSAYSEASVVGSELASDPAGLADQNLQARIRGALIMIRSNHNGWLALATGNKSELAIGYCTLYGDMAGGFAVLCDVFKRDVYGLARHINNVWDNQPPIPERTITKPPSAELAPDQLDQDTLPEYPVLDGILEALIEQERSVESVSEEFPGETVAWVASRLDRNEFKRRQMAPGIKLSSRAFGSGRRMPMAARLETD
jgi:NAD+ synthase (glutamine-hydrolysing)